MSNRKTWISVLIAAVIIVGVLAVSAVGGTARPTVVRVIPLESPRIR